MVSVGISALAIIVAALVGLAAGRRPALVIAALMVFEYRLAQSGLLAQWERRPPVLMVMMVAILVATVWFSRSRRFNRIPLAAIVGVQAFRLPLELVMHRAYEDGLMPVQMSYSGYNLDILSGATAIVAAGMLTWRKQAPRWLVVGWNILGSALLVNIVTIAVASTPVFAAFGRGAALNTWVAHPPYVWLPGVLVPAALLGHLLVWRRISSGDVD